MLNDLYRCNTATKHLSASLSYTIKSSSKAVVRSCTLNFLLYFSYSILLIKIKFMIGLNTSTA
jgi:hypothetical protein